MKTATISPPRGGLAGKKFILGGIVILAMVGFLVVSGLQSTSVYYLTVNEARTQLRPGGTQVVRINGVADLKSVKWDAQNLNLAFDIVEGDRRLPVLYHGVMPDTFQQSESVVVEGTLSTSGVFDARTLLVKCPSRYEPVVAPSI
jgi:cytochrome c-type biogenesis protein CcmE